MSEKNEQKEMSTIIRLPKEMHTALKVKCAHNDQTIKDYVTNLILDDLRKDETPND